MKRFALFLALCFLGNSLSAGPQESFKILLQGLQNRDLEACYDYVSLKTIQLVEKGLKKVLEGDVKVLPAKDSAPHKALLDLTGKDFLKKFLDLKPQVRKNKLPDLSKVKILEIRKGPGGRMELIAEVKPGKAYLFSFIQEKSLWRLDLAETVPDLAKWTTLWVQLGWLPMDK